MLKRRASLACFLFFSSPFSLPPPSSWSASSRSELSSPPWPLLSLRLTPTPVPCEYSCYLVRTVAPMTDRTCEIEMVARETPSPMTPLLCEGPMDFTSRSVELSMLLFARSLNSVNLGLHTHLGPNFPQARHNYLQGSNREFNCSAFGCQNETMTKLITLMEHRLGPTPATFSPTELLPKPTTTPELALMQTCGTHDQPPRISIIYSHLYSSPLSCLCS